MRSDLAAILAQPIAHRGLHDEARGLVENSTSAARAAIARRFGIECDIQITADGQAVVFHDETLERLTGASGRVDARTAADLATLVLRGGDDRIPTLPAFLAEIDGRVPLVIEIKSRFDGDERLALRAVRDIASYEGPVALKSFDPEVTARCRRLGAPCPLGLVGPGATSGGHVSKDHDFLIWHDFLSWDVSAIHRLAAAPGQGVMSWTIRDRGAEEIARHHGGQIIFEAYDPQSIDYR